MAPNYTYRFVRPANYEKLAEANRAEVHAFFRKQFDQAKRGLDMTPEELQLAARTDDTGMLALMAKQQHTREGLNVFANSLSAEQQEQVLAGGDVDVDLAKADDATQTFAANRLKEMTKWNGNSFGPQKTIRFSFDQMGIEHSPSMFIMFDNFGGYAYLGGVPTERKWQARFAAEALIEGDSDTPVEKGLLDQKFMPPLEPESGRKKGEVTAPQVLDEEVRLSYDAEECLARIAEAESPRINFVACLAQKNIINSSMSPVYGQTVAKLIQEMKERSIVAKWRNGILVFRYTAGFSSNDSVAKMAPYPLYKILRDRLDGYGSAKRIPLSDVMEIVGLSTFAQRSNAYKERPIAFNFLNGGLLARVSDVLLALSKQPELATKMESEEGVAVGDLTPALRKALHIPQITPASTSLVFRQSVIRSTPSSGPENVVATWSLKNGGESDPPPPPVFDFTYPVPKTYKEISRILEAKRLAREGQR
jgi:hypothetical protein